MDHQKILNLLNEENDSKIVTRKWNIANDNSEASYGVGNEIIYNTEVLKSNLCEYSDAYILVTGNIAVIEDNGNWIGFTNCTPFPKFIIKIDDITTDDAEDLVLFMPMYNLKEYSSNYFESTGSLWFYNKYETTNFNADIAKLVGNAEADGPNGIWRNVTTAVPLKYFSDFWTSLLINCKIGLNLEWTKCCVFSATRTDNANNNANNANDNNTIFNIKDTKLKVPVDNQKLSKLISKGFERSVSWNEYKTKRDKKYNKWI